MHYPYHVSLQVRIKKESGIFDWLFPSKNETFRYQHNCGGSIIDGKNKEVLKPNFIK